MTAAADAARLGRSVLIVARPGTPKRWSTMNCVRWTLRPAAVARDPGLARDPPAEKRGGDLARSPSRRTGIPDRPPAGGKPSDASDQRGFRFLRQNISGGTTWKSSRNPRGIVSLLCHCPQYCVFTALGPCGGLRIGRQRAHLHSTEVGTEPCQGNSVPTCPSLDHGAWSGRGVDHPQLSRAVGG